MVTCQAAKDAALRESVIPGNISSNRRCQCVAFVIYCMPILEDMFTSILYKD